MIRLKSRNERRIHSVAKNEIKLWVVSFGAKKKVRKKIKFEEFEQSHSAEKVYLMLEALDALKMKY